MLLRRLGNKSRIAQDIIKYFPVHNTYIELFFGAGGMYFNKPAAKYNFLNDIDINVYNCFTVLMRKKEPLKSYIEMIPIHSNFWDECKTRTPENDIEKAVYFLILSNFGYMGKPNSLHFRNGENSKQILLENIEKTYLNLVKNGNMFLNEDFRNVIDKISFTEEKVKGRTFVYSDPPYFETEKYQKKWTAKDVNDCFDVTFNSGMKAAMSEFAHPLILETAKQRNLEIITIGERQSMKKRDTEILIINYPIVNGLFGYCN